MQPQYQIHGAARRALKKELANLKYYHKYLSRYAKLDNDMARFLNAPDMVELPEATKARYDAGLQQIKEIEARLAVPYSQQTSTNDSKPA